MKLPGFLSKPRWQSKDAAIRRAAVAGDSDSELVANLGRLAREDADPQVRLAALKRLGDAPALQRAAHDDADAEVRRQARALWFDHMSGAHAAAPALADRLRLLEAQDDVELLEFVARRGSEPALRRAALVRTARPALLFERALEDSDPGLRLHAVERIGDEAQLLRLAERARKSDKQVSRAARERVDALRLERGDTAALEQRARALCERAEQLLRSPGGAEAEAEVERQWQLVAPRVDASLRARFEAARSLLVASHAPRVLPAPPEPELQSPPLAAESETETELTPAPAEAAADAGDPATDEAVTASLLAQARFAASLDEANTAKRKERERQQTFIDEITLALPAFEEALDAGSLARANAARARIDAARRSLKAELPRALAQSLSAAEARHAQLAQWQRWADDQRRAQLCDEIEALAGAALHPDAVATRIREAQNEWTRLDAADAAQSARPSGLARRFHAACRAALAPAQAYFRKRQEVRQSHAQRIAALLARADAPEDALPWAEVVALRRETAEALRDLDRVEPRERKALAQQVKTRLAALDARVDAHDAEIERAKAALIREAEALTQAGELPRGAAASARALQQRWQQAGNGRRARDQAQWKAFRAAIDAVFSRLGDVRAERQARDVASRDQAQALCEELQRVVDAGADGAPQPGEAARIIAAWNALDLQDDALRRRFDALREALREAGTRRERSERRLRFEAWLQRYRVCRKAELAGEPGEALREEWAQAAVTDIAADALAQRFEAAFAAAASGGVPAGDEDAQRSALVQLELFAGQDTPAEDGERRRALQVERLASRMRAGAATAPADELAALLVRWSRLGPAPAALDARWQSGVAAAIDTLP